MKPSSDFGINSRKNCNHVWKSCRIPVTVRNPHQWSTLVLRFGSIDFIPWGQYDLDLVRDCRRSNCPSGSFSWLIKLQGSSMYGKCWWKHQQLVDIYRAFLTLSMVNWFLFWLRSRCKNRLDTPSPTGTTASIGLFKGWSFIHFIKNSH